MSRKIYKVFAYTVLIIGALLTLFPIWFLVINSFKPQSAILKTPMALPKSLDFQYILNAVNKIDLISSLLVTAMITVVSVTLIVIVSSAVAWMMVRFKSRVSTILLLCFTASMLIPFQALMYPLISQFDGFGLKNVSGLIIMYAGFDLAFSVFIYHGFIKSIPVSLEEAAIMDGANVFQVYVHIIMPLLKPTTATVAILDGMGIWNDFQLPFLVIGNNRPTTLPLSVYYARASNGKFGNAWDLVFPSVFVSVIPILILFLILQKRIMKGVVQGAIKE